MNFFGKNKVSKIAAMISSAVTASIEKIHMIRRIDV
jgi:hypothetical protein